MRHLQDDPALVEAEGIARADGVADGLEGAHADLARTQAGRRRHPLQVELDGGRVAAGVERPAGREIMAEEEVAVPGERVGVRRHQAVGEEPHERVRGGRARMEAWARCRGGPGAR